METQRASGFVRVVVIASVVLVFGAFGANLWEIGKTSQQINANEVIWNFLKQYSK